MVELRARQVPSDYRRNNNNNNKPRARRTSSTDPPARRSSRTASPRSARAAAVVFGNYGEASRDVHTLIHVAAQRLATKHWRLLGARSQGRAVGCLFLGS